MAIGLRRIAAYHFDPTRLCAWDHVVTDAEEEAAVEMARSLTALQRKRNHRCFKQVGI